MTQAFMMVVAILAADDPAGASSIAADGHASAANKPSNAARTQVDDVAPKITIEPASRDVIILAGKTTNRRLEPVSPPDPDLKRREGFDLFPGLKNPGFGITGSGIATHAGTVRPAIHCFTLVERATRKAMRWYIQVASKDDHFITRSAVGWDGDYISGVAHEAAMYARGYRSRYSVEGKKVKQVGYEYDRVTACIQIRLPGASDIKFIFVSFDDQGHQVPAFPGRTPFAEYVNRLQGHNASAKEEGATRAPGGKRQGETGME